MIEEVKIEEIVFTNEYIDMVDLQVEDNENFILENGFLTHNSGKSYLIRAMMDRMRHIGFDVIYLSDVKDEMKSSIKPVQEKFQNGLLPGEKPKGTKVVTLRPTFFKQISDNLNELNFWYSIDINKLTRADFMTLMNVHEMTPNQRTAMDLIFQELQNRFKSDPDLKFSVDLIYNIIDTDEDIDERQKQGLRFKFKPLEYAHFWIEEYQRSIVDLINRGFIPAINMENFDSFGKGNFLFPEVTLNIILREVIEARRAEQINKIWVVIDEASRFVGKTKNTSIKTTVEESYELDSRYGVWYCSAYQSWNDVPDKILSNTRFIFVPRSADVGTLKSVLTNVGVVKNVQSSVNKAIRLKRAMEKKPFSWIIFDRMNASYDLIESLSPLSEHMESTQ